MRGANEFKSETEHICREVPKRDRRGSVGRARSKKIHKSVFQSLFLSLFCQCSPDLTKSFGERRDPLPEREECVTASVRRRWGLSDQNEHVLLPKHAAHMRVFFFSSCFHPPSSINTLLKSVTELAKMCKQVIH